MIAENDWLILRAIEKYHPAFCGPEVIAREACFSISYVVKRLRVLEDEKLVEAAKAKVDERSARYVYKLKEVCDRKEAENANIAHNL